MLLSSYVSSQFDELRTGHSRRGFLSPSLFLCLWLCQLPSPIDAQSEVLTIAVDVIGADALRAWSVSISSPEEGVSYVDQSFQPTNAIGGLSSNVSRTTTGLTVGGSGAGSSIHGQTNLGSLQLSTVGSFEGINVLVTQYTLDLVALGEHHSIESRTIQFTRESPVGDFTGDGNVDFSDFFLFADGFGTNDPQTDIFQDGIVDFSDFFLFADSFGTHGEIVGRVVLNAADLLRLEGVVVIGTISTEGVGVVDIEGTVAPEDTTNVEIIGTISD